MQRYTSLFAVLLMLGLGTGLGRAAHQLAAHGDTESSAPGCHHHRCSAEQRAAEVETEHGEPNAPDSHDECPVCVGLASTKSLMPTVAPVGFFAAPLVAHIVLPQLAAPTLEPLRVLRGRAPPVN